MPVWEQDADLRAAVEGELALLAPETRTSPERMKALLHRDFREVGASGKHWDRETVAAMAAASSGPALRADDVDATRLADTVVLVTYASSAPGGRPAHRSSVWVRESGRWLLRHHQGTPASEEA
jgi:hypothetical protein